MWSGREAMRGDAAFRESKKEHDLPGDLYHLKKRKK